MNIDKQTIAFKAAILAKLDKKGIDELQSYALTELDNYNNQLASTFSLKESLTEIFNSYINVWTVKSSS